MLPIYEVSIGELEAISLVQRPAIEQDFMLFSKQEEMKFSLDEEKHMAFGPALIAEKPIYRVSPSGEEYYVVFTAEVIEHLFTQYMKNKVSNYSLEHSGENIDGVYLIESFIKRKGLQPIGFESVSDGSWFISLKVENEEAWEQLKAGKIKGFSVECLGQLEPRESEIDKLINSILDE